MATMIGIVASRFWNMHPIGIVEHHAVFTKAEERKWERAAWMVYHIMSAWAGDKTPSIDQLLGRVTKL